MTFQNQKLDIRIIGLENCKLIGSIMENKQKYNWAFITAFTIDGSTFGPDLKYESVPEWGSYDIDI